MLMLQPELTRFVRILREFRVWLDAARLFLLLILNIGNYLVLDFLPGQYLKYDLLYRYCSTLHILESKVPVSYDM